MNGAASVALLGCALSFLFILIAGFVRARPLASPGSTPSWSFTKEERLFKYIDYAGTRDALLELEKMYPEIVTVWNAQGEFGVDSPGSCSLVGEPCKQWFARITASPVDPERPEVFFSGELHGNERVGPTTVIEFMRLLAENYYLSNDGNPWLKHLVDTRSIWIMPNANALGYYKNVREENGVDPNRDFPYGNSGRCMKTTAARAINESTLNPTHYATNCTTKLSAILATFNTAFLKTIIPTINETF